MNLRIGRAGLAAVIFGLALGGAAGQDEQLFSTDPSGILELAGQSRLVVDGVPGKIYLRVGKSGELRYMARSLENRREERPVALWLRGRSMVLRPVEGGEEEPLLLEIAVSPGVAAKLDLAGARLSVSGYPGPVEIRALDTAIDARALEDDLQLDLEGGRVVVQGVKGGLKAELVGVEATVSGVEGPVTLSSREGGLSLTEALDEVAIDADGGNVTLTNVGRLDARLREGELRLDAARAGAELRLEQAPLHLANSRGEFRVETDARVTAENLQGGLIVNAFGSGVRGAKINGPVEVVTDNAAVELEEVQGSTRVRGAGLKVVLTKMKGEVWVETSSSTLNLDQVEGAVQIKADLGDVSVFNATRAVKIDSRHGDVRVVNLSGPLDLKADGARVDVSWSALEGETNQSVENARGDVWLTFPSTARGSIQASAPEGAIQSSVAGIRVSDDGSSASGNLGGGLRPVVRARAGGDLYLATSRAVAPPPKEAAAGLRKVEPDQ